MSRKIFIVRKPFISTGEPRSWMAISQELLRDPAKFIDVRYVHRETDKCFYLSHYADAAERKACRQLKADMTYFYHERYALQALHRFYVQLHNEVSEYREALTAGIFTLTHKLDVE